MIEKIDIFRYLLMYYQGGIYCDIDTTCYQKFDQVCQNESCILGIEAYITEKKKKKMNYKYRYSVGNSVLISAPKHPFFYILLHNIINNNVSLPENDVEYVCQQTGPGILTKTIQPLLINYTSRTSKYQDYKIKLLDQIFFYPPSNPPIFNVYPFNLNIHCNHLCDGNWKKNKTDLFNQMNFLPYPWIWMYTYRFDYLLLIATITPLLLSSIKLLNFSFLISLQVFITYLSVILYHTIDSLPIERLFGYSSQQLHQLDNTLCCNTFILLSIIIYFKTNLLLANLNSIFFGIFSYFYYKKYTNNFKMEILYLIPFLLYLNSYAIKYLYFSIPAVFFFWIGLFDFDYYSSRKYHAAWHFFSSLLF